jgi:hypothetical protein
MEYCGNVFAEGVSDGEAYQVRCSAEARCPSCRVGAPVDATLSASDSADSATDLAR